MPSKDLHHQGARGKGRLLSQLKRPHGIVVLAIGVFVIAWGIWTFLLG
jgi:hypothetical protein